MKTNSPRLISGASSILLDSLRIIAAFTVFYVHAHDLWFPDTVHAGNEPGYIAHAAVVVFFVLSGYVIAHTTTSNNRGAKQYAEARLSRLFSIVIPALLLTAVVDVLVAGINPVLHADYERGGVLPRYLITGGFLNEIWLFSSAPPINRPLWSLSFEFWYYAIFGCWFFRKGDSWKSYLLPLLAIVIAGPKILLMMPIWLAGYFAYRFKAVSIPTAVNWFLVALCFIAAGIAVFSIPPTPWAIGGDKFAFANQFITDWCIGIFVALALWLLPQTSPATAVNKSLVRSVRFVGDLTFPLYVLHFPLLVFYMAINPFLENISVMWQAIGFSFLLSAVLGLYFDSKRAYWLRFFRWILNRANVAYHRIPLVNALS